MSWGRFILLAVVLILGILVWRQYRPLPASPEEGTAAEPEAPAEIVAAPESTRPETESLAAPQADRESLAASKRTGSPPATARLALRQATLLKALREAPDEASRWVTMTALLVFPTRSTMRETLLVLNGLDVEQRRRLAQAFRQGPRSRLASVPQGLASSDPQLEVRRVAAEILTELEEGADTLQAHG